MTTSEASNEMLGRMFNLLIKDQSEWSQKTFGSDTDRGPIGPLRHLEKEAVEAAEDYTAGRTDDGSVEIADCFLLVLDAARRAKMSPVDLLTMSLGKQQINKSRKWPTPTSDAPVEHIQE